MPYKRRRKPWKKYRKRYKKRYGNKKKRLRKWGRITRWKLGQSSMLPDTTLVKLKYVDTINMVSVGGIGTYTFSMNSLFDPDTSGVGHQPLGFDQWAAFYSRYQVLASRITVQLLAPDTNITAFAVYPSSDSTAINIYSTAREQPYAKSKYIVTPTSSQACIVSNYMKIKKLEARSIDSLSFIAFTGASPTRQKFWHMILSSVSGTSIGDITVDVKITYYTKFFRRIPLSQS